MLLHGEAPLCATYLAAAGLGRLLVTGALPDLAARDPAFRMERAPPDAPADLVCDLADGAAYRASRGPAIWGAVAGSRVLLGVEPRETADLESGAAARAVLETLAAGEALRLLIGEAPHPVEFEL
ncbi:MAG: hypothetical protein ACYTGV_14725 [Planctomycetota bacterium]